MENIVCSRYGVVGIKDAIHRLKDAIENSDGNVDNVLQNLGLATCDFGDSELLSMDFSCCASKNLQNSSA